MGDLAQAANAYFDMIEQSGGKLPLTPLEKFHDPTGAINPHTLYEDMGSMGSMNNTNRQPDAQTQAKGSSGQQVPEEALNDRFKSVAKGLDPLGVIQKKDAQGVTRFWIAGRDRKVLTLDELKQIAPFVHEIKAGNGEVWVSLNPAKILTPERISQARVSKTNLPD